VILRNYSGILTAYEVVGSRALKRAGKDPKALRDSSPKRFCRSLEKPNTLPSLRNLFQEKDSSKKNETRAGGIIPDKEKPIPAFESAEDGFSLKIF